MTGRNPIGVTYFPVTPFDENGDLDIDTYKNRIDDITKQADFSAIFPMGSIGEFPYLSIDERKQVIDATVDEVGDRLAVFPGTHTLTTRRTVALSQYAEEAGADGVLVNPQSYYPPTPDEIFTHYETINDAIDIELFAYNNPNTTKVDMEVDLVERLATLDNLNYYKSGTFELRSFREIMLNVGDDLAIYSAPPHMFEKLAFGAHGWTGPVANIDPEASIDFFEAFQNGDLAEARNLFATWEPVLDFFFTDHLSSVMKAILDLQGYDVGDPRPPIQPLPDERKAELESAMRNLDLI